MKTTYIQKSPPSVLAHMDFHSVQTAAPSMSTIEEESLDIKMSSNHVLYHFPRLNAKIDVLYHDIEHLYQSSNVY